MLVLKPLRYILLNQEQKHLFALMSTPQKWWKIFSDFTLKALFVLKIFKFLSFWSCTKNSLIKKIRLISEFMTSQPELYNISGCWSRDIFKFEILKKDLKIVSPSYFVHNLSRKVFLKLFCINWPNFIVWYWMKMHIALVCFSVFDVLSFEINLIFIIKSFFYMT